MDIGQRHLGSAIQLMTSLQTEELQLDDLCRILALSTLRDFGATSVFIYVLEPNATVSLAATFGNSPSFKNDYQNIPLFKRVPATACIQTNEIIYIPSAKALIEQFLESAVIDNIPDFNSLYVVPIRKFSAPVGAIAISGKLLPLTESTSSFLELMSLMIATRFTSRGEYIEISGRTSATEVGAVALTILEGLIQKGMSKGFTNANIALDLGYSESAIRQAAMTLFTKLGVSNRAAAGSLLEI